MVSLGEIKVGRGRFVKAFEDKEKENVFQDSHLPLFHRYLLILPPAFNLQVKKGSECSQIFLPRAECCSGIMQREMHTADQESAHSILCSINVYVTPCARDSKYEFHVLQKLWCMIRT